MKTVLISLFCLTLAACVSGAPRLTIEQTKQLQNIGVFKMGESPKKEYSELEKVKAADCSGTPAGGRLWGDAEKAIDVLKRKTVAIGADAVMNVSCSSAPFLNNCWAAKACSGLAIKYE